MDSGEDGGYELTLRKFGKRRHEVVASSALYVDPFNFGHRGAVSVIQMPKAMITIGVGLVA